MKQRAYQIEARQAAFAAWDRGERGVLIHAPTGAGKSLIDVKTAEEWLRKRGGHVLMLAQDSRELVRQAAQNFRLHTRLSVGVEMGRERVDRAELPDAVCATTQTMARRLADFPPSAFSLLIFDEADHAAAKTWRKIRDHFWSACILGTTATPRRHDGASLRPTFSVAYRAATHRQLIDDGQIARIRQQSVRVLDLSAIVLPPGAEPDAETLGRIMSEEQHLHAVVEPTIRFAEQRATIVFAVTVSHARALAAMFNRYRPGSSRAVWGRMPRDERTEALRAFQSRDYQFLVNVAVLGRGVDLPFVSCVAMARPTFSTPLYEHAIGRGWRAHPDKSNLLVLDFCENAEMHTLISAVDVLAGKEVDEETKERARERLDEQGGGDVLEALDGAARDLIDPAVRARVRARVRTRVIEIDPFRNVDWSKTNAQIGRDIGKHAETVRLHRKALGIPPLPRSEAQRQGMYTRTPEQRSETMRKNNASKTLEQRREIARKAKAAMTPEQRSEAMRKANASRTPEQRREIARKVMASVTSEQFSDAVRKGKAAVSPELRSEVARKGKAAMSPEQRSEAARKGHATRRSRSKSGSAG